MHFPHEKASAQQAIVLRGCGSRALGFSRCVRQIALADPCVEEFGQVLPRNLLENEAEENESQVAVSRPRPRRVFERHRRDLVSELTARLGTPEDVRPGHEAGAVFEQIRNRHPFAIAAAPVAEVGRYRRVQQ